MKKNENGNNSRVSMIKIKGGYSERMGIVAFNVDLQVDDFDDRTRMIISNTMFDILVKLFDERYAAYRGDIMKTGNGSNEFCKRILSDVFVERTNIEEGYIYKWRPLYDRIHRIILIAPYNEVLDIIWYICRWLSHNMVNRKIDIYKAINIVFENECVGYRFVEQMIVAITDKNEINEIERACNCKYDGCKSHMQKAVGFLADREKKDYKNSIKESISAIESICQIITGDDKASLGQALKTMKDNGLVLHPALEKSFASLYGYTSDKGGIRHCEGLFESDVSFEEAKFMFVSCSAFLNYLIAENEKVEGNLNKSKLL